MVGSALIMLYRTNDYYKVSRHNPKTILTFNCARNMIIETCSAESEWLQRHGWFNSTRPCFIGLCCLYGAAAHLDGLCVDGLSAEDRGILRNAVSDFARRWKISGMTPFLLLYIGGCGTAKDEYSNPMSRQLFAPS